MLLRDLCGSLSLKLLLGLYLKQESLDFGDGVEEVDIFTRGLEDVGDVLFALLDGFEEQLALLLVVLEAVEVLLEDAVAEWLDSNHLLFEVLELLGGVHLLVWDELIRLIDLPQQLLQVRDLKTRHLTRGLKEVLGVIFVDLDIGWHVYGGYLFVLPDLGLARSRQLSATLNVRDSKVWVPLLLLNQGAQVQTELGVDVSWLRLQEVVIERACLHDALASLHSDI